MEQIRILIAQNKNLEAIKLYAQMTGASLKDAKAYIDAISDKSDVTVYRPDTGRIETASQHMARIRALAAQNKKLEAIKLYMQMTGANLKDAKAYIDALPAESNNTAQGINAGRIENTTQHIARIRALAAQNNKLEAVKLYMQMTGANLKDAKIYVDAVSDKLGNPAHRPDAGRKTLVAQHGEKDSSASYSGPDIEIKENGKWFLLALFGMLAAAVAFFLQHAL